jgi:membrane-associated phospholipid phosphatase
MSTWPDLPVGTPRLWAVPGAALAGLAMLAVLGPAANTALFTSINHAAGLLNERFWSAATVIGDTLVAFTLLLFMLRRHPEWVMAVLLAALPAVLLSHGLKEWFASPRPYAVLGDSVHVIGPYLKAGAFPSGHTTTAFTLAGVLALGVRRQGWLLAALALAALAALSRVAVGAHWPVDLLGGILCGWVSAWIGVTLARRWRLEQRPLVLGGVRLLLIACALTLWFRYASGYPLARGWEQFIALAALTAHLLPGWRLEGAAEAPRGE